ncbi:LuxR C-terminal-related transcriptional regulator [Streptomyces vinaceus]|uniref:LuxR C-terminal-related transcriptional regulator n=1 Tax=Streptomyces vinaceus TaxID=1960 RepID=UPI0035E23857
MAQEQWDRAVRTLCELHLLRPVDDSEDILVPVSPEAAAAQLVAPIESEIQHRQQLADRVRSDLAALAPIYFDSRRRRHSEEAVDVLDDAATVVSVLSEIAAKCTKEVLTVQPGGGRPPEVLADAFPRDLAMLNRGVKIRTLYQHTARFSAATQRYAVAMEQAGAEVRTVEELFSRMLIFDREVVILPSQDARTGAVVTREPSIVAAFCAVFEQLWQSAAAFSGQVPGSGEFDDAKRAILQMLVAGHKDEVIARRMGQSVRTCRRHIAEIMQRVEADSRFQAGYIIAQQESS